MSRRASAFASASEAALRLPEAFEELYTANPMAAMTTMMRTSKTPFMASSVPTGKLGALASSRHPG
jgi:phenylalanyl-tRNA synthetase beta subunit